MGGAGFEGDVDRCAASGVFAIRGIADGFDFRVGAASAVMPAAADFLAGLDDDRAYCGIRRYASDALARERKGFAHPELIVGYGYGHATKTIIPRS